MSLTREQASHLAHQLGLDGRDLRVRAVGGGDTSPACLISAGNASAFVKLAPPEKASLLSAEADGLAALARTDCVRVPQVLAAGYFDEGKGSWLALEALELATRGELADQQLGRRLAELHALRHRGEGFGWHHSNYLGAAPQPNQWCTRWAEFFRDQRLAPQVERLLADRSDRGLKDLADDVLERWMLLAAGHQPEASLIHGDLWSGNAAALADDTPVIYDPAVHYADRECDLAMAALFGGFSANFFRAYEQAWPLPAGWRRRRYFYQLYHLINHANLFGGGYVAQVKELMRRLIVTP